MLLLLFFTFLSGIVTIFAPCIWPLLPIILSASATGEKRKPLGIVTGIALSFTVFTLSLSYILKIIPFDPDGLRLFGVVIIALLGVTLAVPALGKQLEGWVSRLSSFGGRFLGQSGNGFWSGFTTGAALGLVWSPCAGPILATVATLAATQAVSFAVVLVTLAFVSGVAVPLYIFSTVGQTLLTKTRALSPYTGRIQQAFGIIMIFAALAIYTGYDRVLQTKLLDTFPGYGNFLNQFEKNDAVKNELDQLKNPSQNAVPMNTIKEKLKSVQSSFENRNQAPEFVGIEAWLNTPDGKPITLESLRGKVVLVDFWMYSCINCIRTLPYVTGWYEKYKDQGFVVVGVHTPEFAFEKKQSNVEEALKRFNIQYPVALDNEYGTWQAYNNHYWPAHYLIDAEGNIRETHFGEGKYEETEHAIQMLLREAGEMHIPEVTPHQEYQISAQTPETYVGYARSERNDSIPAIQKGASTVYVFPETLPSKHWAFSGGWTVLQEYAVPEQGAKLEFHFEAKDVFLVLKPRKTGVPAKVSVLLDGAKQGLSEDNVEGIVTVESDRLYHLIHLDQPGVHTLQLQFEDAHAEVYAFTFG